MALSGIDTPLATPGEAVGLGKSGDTDPVKAGKAKGSKKDDTPLSKLQNLKKDSKDSKEKKEFSDKETEPKNGGDSGSRVKPKRSKPQKKKAPIKKPAGKSASHIDSCTESEDDKDEDDVNDDDDVLEPEEKTITMTLRGNPDFEDTPLTKFQRCHDPEKERDLQERW